MSSGMSFRWPRAAAGGSCRAGRRSGTRRPIVSRRSPASASLWRSKGSTGRGTWRCRSTSDALASHVADCERFLERVEGLALGNELLTDEARVAHVGDRGHHAPIVELLRAVDLVAPGNTARMEVGDVRP